MPPLRTPPAASQCLQGGGSPTPLPTGQLLCYRHEGVGFLLDVCQLQTLFCLKYAVMKRKDLSCDNKLANFAFRKQSKEVKLAQPRSVHTVKLDYFSPMGFIFKTVILDRRGPHPSSLDPQPINAGLYTHHVGISSLTRCMQCVCSLQGSRTHGF